MAEFLLIHGSCHGAWCWEKTIDALQALGHSARAIDLPGHGTHPMAPEDVTLDDYARAVDEALERPTHLVGHSMAGIVLSAAAEIAADRIASLIYLAAFPPLANKSVVDMQQMYPEQPLRAAIRVSQDRMTWSADPDVAIKRFYHDVPADVARDAVARLTREPMAPQLTRIEAAAARALPRHYILCEEDHSVATGLQEIFTADWQGGEVLRMPGSHSPFLARPDALARGLAGLAERSPAAC